MERDRIALNKHFGNYTNETMTSDPKKVTGIIKETDFSYSFEVTPDLNKDDLRNLDATPAFFSVTWHAKSHKCKDLDIEPLKLAEYLRSQGKEVLMHLSCDLMKRLYLEKLLAFLQEKGICNLFLVLGESFDPSSSDFQSTSELIKYIRQTSGKYFCIGIAGNCECDDDKLLQLKEKVEAGADFIVTQAFFEAKVYRTFVAKCTGVGINVPVLPGIFPFENEKQLTNFANMCKVKVSKNILDLLNKGEGISVEILRDLMRTIRLEFHSAHFHFFTLNKLNNVCKLIKEV